MKTDRNATVSVWDSFLKNVVFTFWSQMAQH